jgi:hypothetical protein
MSGRSGRVLTSTVYYILCTRTYFRAQALIDLIDSCTATYHVSHPSKNDSQLWLRQLHEVPTVVLQVPDSLRQVATTVAQAHIHTGRSSLEADSTGTGSVA